MSNHEETKESPDSLTNPLNERLATMVPFPLSACQRCLATQIGKKIMNLAIYSCCVMAIFSILLSNSSAKELKNTGIYFGVCFGIMAIFLCLVTYPPTCLRSREAFEEWRESIASATANPASVRPSEITVIECSMHCKEVRKAQMVFFSYHNPEDCPALRHTLADASDRTHDQIGSPNRRHSGAEWPLIVGSGMQGQKAHLNYIHQELQVESFEADVEFGEVSMIGNKSEEVRPASESHLPSQAEERVVVVRPATSEIDNLSLLELVPDRHCLPPDCCNKCCGMAVVHNDCCAICLCEYQTNDLMARLSGCNHIFHQECIEGWIEQHNKCPMCKAVLSPTISHRCLQPVVLQEGRAMMEQESSDDESMGNGIFGARWSIL